MTAVEAVAPDLGPTQACRALGISRATLYRRRRPPAPPASRSPRPRPPRALSDPERQAVRAVLHAPRFCDTAPAEVVATLLDEGVYLASERTMYRILAQAGQTGERRDQLIHPVLLGRSCWRPGRTSSGAGTSPSCSARPPGPTSTCTSSSTSSAATWSAGRSPTPNRPRWPSGCSPRPSPSSRSRLAADRACRPGLLHDLQAGRLPARRPRRHQDPLPPPRLQRQPVFREPVQDPQVPARLPRPLRLHPGRPGLLPGLLPLVQRRAPPLRDRDDDPPGRPLRPRRQLHQARAQVLAAAYAAHPERFVRQPPAPRPCPPRPGSTRPSRHRRRLSKQLGLASQKC